MKYVLYLLTFVVGGSIFDSSSSGESSLSYFLGLRKQYYSHSLSQTRKNTLKKTLVTNQRTPKNGDGGHDSLRLLGEGNKMCMLNSSRLDTIYIYYSLLSPTDRNAKQVPVSESMSTYAKIVVSENDIILNYNGSGIFKGAEDGSEYNALGHLGLNGGDFAILYTKVLNINCKSADMVEVTVELKTWTSATGRATNQQVDTFTFASNQYSLLDRIDTFVPQAVYDIMKVSKFDQRTLCETALLRCPGDLYPYKDLQDCYEITSHIPQICTEGRYTDNYTGGILQGDTMACRYLHLISAGLRPSHHCPHLSDMSEKCRLDQCPSVHRLEGEDVAQIYENFDAGHAVWIRVIEILLFLLFVGLCLFAKIWHMKARNNLFDRPDSDKQHNNSIKKNERSISTRESLPSLKFEDIQLSWSNADPEDSLVISGNGYLGGCTMTGISGPSGSGKTTFLKLICGLQASHMTISVGRWTQKHPVAYCPQSGNMWPCEMPVKDILLFASSLARVSLHRYFSCFELLGIADLLDQEFGTLSGGQQQRVNIAAAIIQPSPSVILLDEPLAALDNENALACARVLKTLPIKHAFVMTNHRLDPEIADEFDRILHFDPCIHELKELRSPPHDAIITASERVQHWDTAADIEMTTSSRVGSLQAALVLWYSQFYGMPMIEAIIVFASCCGAVLVGFLARKSTVDWESDHMPSEESLRIPFYIADILVGMSIITSFGVSIIYANKERELVEHYMKLRALDPLMYLVASLLLRNAFHGIIQAVAWVLISVPIMGMTAPELDIILVNSAIFCFAWGGSTFGVALMAPVMYCSHAVMIMDVLMIFFSGVFFYMSRLYGIFRALHYINPLFYILSANAYLVGLGLDTGCGVKDHPGTCISGSRILEMDDITPFTSIAAQGYNILFVGFFSVVTWIYVRPDDPEGTLILTEVDNDNHNNRRSQLGRSKTLRSVASNMHIADTRMTSAKYHRSMMCWSTVQLNVSTRIIHGETHHNSEGGESSD